MLRMFMFVLAFVTFGIANAEAKDIKVGIILGFTGPIESLTPDMAAGAELAFAEASDSGALLGGSTISVSRADSTCIDSAAATTAAEGLVSEGVTAIVGADCSGVTGAVLANVAVPKGVPMISPSATSPALTTAEDNGLFFRTAPSDARGGEVLADITADRGVSSVAITYVNTDYGVGLADVYEAAAEARGIEVTTKTPHEGDKADYSAEVGVLSSAGGDALVVVGYLDQGGNQIIRGSLDTGAFDTFILSDGMIGDSLTDAFGSELNGSFGSMPGSTSPGALKFAEYAEANGVNPSVYVGESYDAAALIVLAMASADCDISGCAGSDDSASIADNILSVANGPGVKIYAGELAKGIRLASAGNAINYEGATDVNFTDGGEAFGAFLEKAIEGGSFVNASQR
ncbi:MAG: branched-chain amino acid ABC transporter substrate-binding protein [Rhodobiaceae bacterium]|nr:branched-chain amino acid ABC transporter substrate-binding protein [Rhodobiaceae bacterium]MEC7088187.1 ABC transporter substrate-binding protein [Pseudomonadota bacterium]MEC7090219.1 ABC transporter substrate-binding protein [Pseudomonadota bacterium]MEC7928172.1 ABC transporter substrate-binding protein [Pseudomonadota bacterium]|tara:strand:+ start:23018 stop:24223 length:1206 start_codon:yes stop_codon:yes gene_type:complete